jgi:hypothetical protein
MAHRMSNHWSHQAQLLSSVDPLQPYVSSLPLHHLSLLTYSDSFKACKSGIWWDILCLMTSSLDTNSNHASFCFFLFSQDPSLLRPFLELYHGGPHG